MASKRSSSNQNVSRERKRAKIKHFRHIAVQTTANAFKDGAIDVQKFVKARQFEITALHSALHQAKNASSSRAFQELPRELRRRTASHNVKRIPRKYRARALREMKIDNVKKNPSSHKRPTPRQRLRLFISAQKKPKSPHTLFSQSTPSIKNSNDSPKRSAPKQNKRPPYTLCSPDLPPSKFRKRQKSKLWLPTHLFHAKRARMTSPSHPIWGFSLPLTPSMKCYRSTHRAFTNSGCIMWDMSYMSTIRLEGREINIIGLLRDLSVNLDYNEGFSDPNKSAWLQGSRVWNTWLFKRQVKPLHAIAPVHIIWCHKKLSKRTVSSQRSIIKRKLLLRVHPSALFEVWGQIVRAANVQKPSVKVEDLRHRVGSIEITGPSALLALTKILKPWSNCLQTGSNCTNCTSDSLINIWQHMGEMKESSTSFPNDALICFNAVDPRLHYPFRQCQMEADSALDHNQDWVKTWQVDNLIKPSGLFNYRKLRQRPVKQKVIDYRKFKALPGEEVKRLETDSHIPIIIYSSIIGNRKANQQRVWTVLLPVKFVLPVWQCLIKFHVRKSGQVRFGGLNEYRQLYFERGVPWYPGDFPGVQAGYKWELDENEVRREKWRKQVPGKRIEWARLSKADSEIGDGLGNNWNIFHESIPDEIKNSHGVTGGFNMKNQKAIPICRHINMDVALMAFRSFKLSKPVFQPDLVYGFMCIRITMIDRGVPRICDRIYRLPSKDILWRNEWLKVYNRLKLIHKKKSSTNNPFPDSIGNITRNTKYPPIPDKDDLLGYVTTGNFNLKLGQASGLGYCSIYRCLLMDKCKWKNGSYTFTTSQISTCPGTNLLKLHRNLCIIKSPNHRFGKLAAWELV